MHPAFSPLEALRSRHRSSDLCTLTVGVAFLFLHHHHHHLHVLSFQPPPPGLPATPLVFVFILSHLLSGDYQSGGLTSAVHLTLLSRTATLPPTGRRQPMLFITCTTLLFLCSSCCLCFFSSVVPLLSYISLLSLSSCVAFQEREAQTRGPISSVAPPPAAAARPLAEPSCDRRLARPFTCNRNLKSGPRPPRDACMQTCAALVYPCRCVKCWFPFEQPSCLLCVCVFSVVYLFA